MHPHCIPPIELHLWINNCKYFRVCQFVSVWMNITVLEDTERPDCNRCTKNIKLLWNVLYYYWCAFNLNCLLWEQYLVSFCNKILDTSYLFFNDPDGIDIFINIFFLIIVCLVIWLAWWVDEMSIPSNGWEFHSCHSYETRFHKNVPFFYISFLLIKKIGPNLAPYLFSMSLSFFLAPYPINLIGIIFISDDFFFSIVNSTSKEYILSWHNYNIQEVLENHCYKPVTKSSLYTFFISMVERTTKSNNKAFSNLNAPNIFTQC